MLRRFSTRQAAKHLGIGESTLANYLEVGKIRKPDAVIPGKRPTYVWTEEEIEKVRHLLPKIANGRKTRYKKKQSAVSNQQSAKAKSRTKSKTKSRSKKKKK